MRWDGGALTAAPAEFLNDNEVVLIALQNCGQAYYNTVSKELQQNREIVLAAVRSDGYVLERVPDHFRGDLEVVLAAMDQDPSAVQFASQEFFVALAKRALDCGEEQPQNRGEETQQKSAKKTYPEGTLGGEPRASERSGRVPGRSRATVRRPS